VFEELKDVAPNITQEKFDRMDRNDDGVISKDDRHHHNKDADSDNKPHRKKEKKENS